MQKTYPNLDHWSNGSAQPVSIRAEAHRVDFVISFQRVQMFSFVQIPKHGHPVLWFFYQKFSLNILPFWYQDLLCLLMHTMNRREKRWQHSSNHYDQYDSFSACSWPNSILSRLYPIRMRRWSDFDCWVKIERRTPNPSGNLPIKYTKFQF